MRRAPHREFIPSVTRPTHPPPRDRLGGGARRADPRRALQHRAPGAARPDPGRRPEGHRRAAPRTRRPAPRRRERPRPARVYRILARAIKDERAITPAAEWLVDNFPIVDEQLREIRDDLPADYYRELPKLADGHLAGYPRVLGLAWAYIAHTDSRFDPESLRRMVRRLSGGRAADDRRAVGDRDQPAHPPRRQPPPPRRADRRAAATARQTADELADGLLGLGDERARGRGGGPAPAVDERAPDRGAGPAVPASARSGSGGHPGPPLARGDASPRRAPPPRRRSASSTSARPTMNVTVRNVITSMRLISWFDWAQFVESVSLVDEVLRAAERVRGRWTSRPATATATPSRSWPAGRAGREIEVARRPSRWRTPPRSRRTRRRGRAARSATPAST